MNKGKILIVEDERKIRSLMQIYLEQNDYTVIMAEDGIEALKLIQKTNPDLVVLDILMPKMDGFAVCKEIRQMEKFQELPIIYVSSLSEKQTIISSLENGADDFITKPFDPNELVARINAILRRSRLTGTQRSGLIEDFYDKLTHQEIQIIHLMEKGYTNKEIALELYLTEGTIKVYNHNLFQKLHVKNRTQAIVFAKERQII